MGLTLCCKALLCRHTQGKHSRTTENHGSQQGKVQTSVLLKARSSLGCSDTAKDNMRNKIDVTQGLNKLKGSDMRETIAELQSLPFPFIFSKYNYCINCNKSIHTIMCPRQGDGRPNAHFCLSLGSLPKRKLMAATALPLQSCGGSERIQLHFYRTRKLQRFWKSRDNKVTQRCKGIGRHWRIIYFQLFVWGFS